MMTRPFARSFLTALTLFVPVLRADSRPATKEEVFKLADAVPALDSGRRERPFVMRGVLRSTETAYAYEVVSTDYGYRAAMLDPDDDVPLIISTEITIAVLDIYGGKVFTQDLARYAMDIRADGKALSTRSRWLFRNHSDELPPTVLDIAPAIRAAAEGSLIETSENGAVKLTQRVDGNRTRNLFFQPPPSRNFAFGQIDTKTQAYTSFHQVTLDEEDLMHAGATFPRFDKEMPVDHNDPDLMEEGRFQMSGDLGKLRRGIRGEVASREWLGAGLFDWEKLADINKQMEADWLAVLKKQRIQIQGPERPWKADDAASSPANSSATSKPRE